MGRVPESELRGRARGRLERERAPARREQALEPTRREPEAGRVLEAALALAAAPATELAAGQAPAAALARVAEDANPIRRRCLGSAATLESAISGKRLSAPVGLTAAAAAELRETIRRHAPTVYEGSSVSGGFEICFNFAIMTTSNTNPSGVQRDPDEWKTGDEPMTAAQRSYLETLATETGETVDEHLTKAEASKLIDELRQRSPRLTAE